MSITPFKNRLFYHFSVLFLLFALTSLTSCRRDIKADPKKNERQANGKRINIISNKNGVGLSQDVEILEEELTKLGHQVAFVEDKQLEDLQKADINILVQPLNLGAMPYAEKNYLIPNPEWCYFKPEEIAKLDMILCKTREGERIFKALNHNTVFIGFTCKDRYDSSVEKNYKSPLHLAGKSSQKGTAQLVKTWIRNPQWPQLTMIKNQNDGYPPASNINYLYGYRPFEELKTTQNKCGLHLCPSETEGFGYYIMEGLSTGAVVVATDSPPMNEFVKDKRCLVGVQKSEPMQFAVRYFVDPKKFDSTVTDLLSLSEAELKEIGTKNREFYLENDRQFKTRLAEIFSN